MPIVNRISCVIGTAGHIDHGKTSLVKSLTGIDTDRLKEEKQRGVSIELGFAHIDLDVNSVPGEERLRAAIVDVPGHEKFIKNMLAGTTGIDMVLFAVAADDGVMPQTVEHLDIVRLLGVSSAVFAITKSDLADEKRVKEVEADIRDLIKGTRLEGSAMVAVSNATGDGVRELKDLIRKNIKARGGSGDGFFRLPVDRSFTVKGFGAVVTGTVASGLIKKDSDALVFPTGARVRVRALQSLYMDTGEVRAGERAAVNISGVSHADIERGYCIITDELRDVADFARAKKPLMVDCEFELLSGGKRGALAQLRHNSLLKLHHLTGETLASVRLAGAKEAAPGSRFYGRLVLKKALPMMRGDRFILRNPAVNKTIGGGTVLIPYYAVEFVQRLSKDLSPERFGPAAAGLSDVLRGVFAKDTAGIPLPALSLMLNMKGDVIKSALTGAGKGGFGVLGAYAVDLEKIAALKKLVIDRLASYHASNPLEPGMKEEGLLKGLTVGAASTGVVKAVVDFLVASKELKRDGNLIALPSHRPASRGADAAIEDAILRLFGKGAFEQPSPDDLKRLPFKPADTSRVFSYLQRSGVIVRLKEQSFLLKTSVDAAKEKLINHINGSGSIKAAEFRDVLGCGRKLAIEILEYFDKERVTLRQGDIRKLR